MTDRVLIRYWSRIKLPEHTTLHGVVSAHHNGTTTACRGGWKASDPVETFPLDAVQQSQVCEFCWGVWVDQRSERGFRDLLDGTYSRIGLAIRAFRDELARFSPADLAGFDTWLGPCSHDFSPISRCASCAPHYTTPEHPAQ